MGTCILRVFEFNADSGLLVASSGGFLLVPPCFEIFSSLFEPTVAFVSIDLF